MVQFTPSACQLAWFLPPSPRDQTAGWYFLGKPTTSHIHRMEGHNIFMGKMMSVFIRTDKMIGKDFEAGRASLR